MESSQPGEDDDRTADKPDQVEQPAADHDGVPLTTSGADDPTAGDSTAASMAEPVESRRRWLRRNKPGKPRRKAPWWELPALILVAILVAIGLQTFVIQPYYIPSGSMEHTLHGCPGCDGDRILVNKTIYYFRDPEPGDIVVFHLPKDWSSDEPTSTPPSNPILRVIRGFGQLIGFVPPDGEVLVKRVIAVGGQSIRGDSKGDIWVKDAGAGSRWRELNESSFVFDDPGVSQPAFGPVTVPKGRLWVMGDHRTNSADSRYHCEKDDDSPDGDTHCNAVSATVPNSDVIGKAIVIAWPPSRWRTLGTPSTFSSAAAAGVTSGGVPVLTVLPIYLIRRRRRRRAVA